MTKIDILGKINPGKDNIYLDSFRKFGINSIEGYIMEPSSFLSIPTVLNAGVSVPQIEVSEDYNPRLWDFMCHQDCKDYYVVTHGTKKGSEALEKIVAKKKLIETLPSYNPYRRGEKGEEHKADTRIEEAIENSKKIGALVLPDVSHIWCTSVFELSKEGVYPVVEKVEGKYRAMVDQKVMDHFYKSLESLKGFCGGFAHICDHSIVGENGLCKEPFNDGGRPKWGYDQLVIFNREILFPQGLSTHLHIGEGDMFREKHIDINNLKSILNEINIEGVVLETNDKTESLIRKDIKILKGK
jgi:hypothetical protein